MTILVADDDATSRKLLRVSLEAEGHEILEATDGYEALAAVNKQPVDAVIADVFMPRLDGYELCREFRSQRKCLSMPFIFYSGAVASQGAQELARQVGAHAYVAKPDLRKLLTILHSIGADRRPKIERAGEVIGADIPERTDQRRGFELAHKTHELQASEERAKMLAAIVENSRDAIISKTLDGTITSWNPAAERLYGYEAREVIGQPVTILMPQGRQQEWGETVDRLRQNQPVNAFETVRLTKNGSPVHVSIQLSPIRNQEGSIVGISGIDRDVTKQKRDEEALRESREQLRMLAARMETAREAEALRISREVHDELGQMLTALNLDLVALQKQVTRGAPVAKLVQRIQEIEEMLASTISTVQRISYELRPAILDDLGLVAALEWQAEEFKKRSGIDVQWRNRASQVILPRATSTAVFRIFQEILTNVARHARATEVVVELSQVSEAISLLVRDNGVGFSPEKVCGAKALGLLGMRERALLFGGEVMMESAPGKGTNVTLHISVRTKV